MEKEMQKVNAGRERNRYSKEFKLAAVKLLQSGTKPGTLTVVPLIPEPDCFAGSAYMKKSDSST